MISCIWSLTGFTKSINHTKPCLIRYLLMRRSNDLSKKCSIIYLNTLKLGYFTRTVWTALSDPLPAWATYCTPGPKRRKTAFPVAATNPCSRGRAPRAGAVLRWRGSAAPARPAPPRGWCAWSRVGARVVHGLSGRNWHLPRPSPEIKVPIHQNVKYLRTITENNNIICLAILLRYCLSIALPLKNNQNGKKTRNIF